MADEQRTVLIDLEIDENASVESINSLTRANKALREERNKLNLQSVEGKKRLAEINTTIDQNTGKIKENVSALEKQKINIGNYKSALEGVVPGLSNVSGGIEKVSKTTSLLTKAMGPWTIILGLVISALALLGKYLFGTQEGVDKVTAVTRPLLAVMDRLSGVLQELGGKVFKQLAEAVTNPIQAIKNLGNSIVGLFKTAAEAVTNPLAFIERIRNGVNALTDFVDEAVSQGQRLDALQKQIERDEITQIKRTKELNLLVKQSKVIVEDETKSFKERTAAALLARGAQNEILSSELNLLDKRIEKIKLQQSLNDTSREDEKELAELEARRFEVQATNAEQSIEFDKKINELRVKNNLLLAEQAALERANRRAANQVEGSTEDPLQDAFSTQLNNELKQQEDFNKRLAKTQKDATDEAIRQKERERVAKEALNKIIAEQELATISGFLGAAMALFDEQSTAYKAFATFQTLISTYSTAQKAYEAAFVPPTVASPALGAVNVGLAIAQGIANVAAINGVQFAEGGFTGKGGKFEPAGIVHKGEYVAPQHIVNSPMAQPHINALEGMRVRGYADGGFVTNQNTSQAQQSLLMLNAIKNLPPGVVSWSEGRAVGNRVIQRENVARMGSKKARI